MKLSVTWLLEHIKEKASFFPLSDEFVKKMADRLGARTTELDQVKKIEYPLERLTLAQLKEKRGDTLVFFSSELRKEYTLEPRKDATVASWYLLIQEGKTYRYATMADLHGTKEGLVPALWVSEAEEA